MKAKLKEMLKIVIVSVALIANLSSSASVHYIEDQSKDPTDLPTARFIEKSVNLVTQLFKTFESLKSDANGEKKVANIKHDLIPYDGMSYDPMQGGWHDLELIDDHHKEKKKPEPQFWVFDNFSKKVDLIFLTKVLLKIIVFKKIIKFIALVCLLFFLPTLKDDSSSAHGSSEEKKEERSLDIYGSTRLFHKLEHSFIKFDFRSNRLSNKRNSCIRCSLGRSVFCRQNGLVRC